MEFDFTIRQIFDFEKNAKDMQSIADGVSELFSGIKTIPMIEISQ